MTLNLNLEGKVALITGAARGQGRAHAVTLASLGADIVAIDIAAPLPDFIPYDSATPEDLAQTQQEVEALDRRIITEQADVRDLERLKEIAQRAVSELGSLDIVIANAGICQPSRWDEITPEAFRDTIDVNVVGVWNTVMATAPHMVAAGKGGAYVLTSSYAGRKMQPFMVHYTASKHAVTGMTRAFAAELGPHGIRVNSVHPGGVATGMTTGDMMGAMERAAADAPKLSQMGQTFMEPGWSEAQRIADAVAFLVSPLAEHITAEHLSVDQGMQHF